MTILDLNLDILMPAFFVLVILVPVAVGILKLMDPSAGVRPRTLLYEFQQRRNRVRDAVLMRNLQDPATYTLYDAVHYPDDK